MKYIWTEDTGAGLHFWELANIHLFEEAFVIESKGSNQGILDAVRHLVPDGADSYYLAFDVVYDNMDVMNKYLELKELSEKYPEQIIILDMICFEHLILSFSKLIEWTGTRKRDKIALRAEILQAISRHMIDIDRIVHRKTKEYLSGFKRYSTERVIKAITYELTENEAWSVKGRRMGDCWYKDCCSRKRAGGVSCGMTVQMNGSSKIIELFRDAEIQKVLVSCLQDTKMSSLVQMKAF